DALPIWTIVVVHPREQLHDRSRMIPVMERLQIQTLISQRSVEALVLSVLPRTAWVNVTRFDAVDLHHVHEEPGDELRTVVGSDEGRRAVNLKQSQQRSRHELRIHLMLDFNLDASSCELIDDRQDAEFSVVFRAIFHEVVRPHMIRMLGSTWHA